MQIQLKCLLIVLSLLPGLGASALILELDPPVRLANAGDVVTFDIVLDPDGDFTLGGGLDVVFDPSAVVVIDYEYGTLGDPQFNATPVKGDGRLVSIGVGNFQGLFERGVIATITVRVLRDGLTRIELDDTQGIAGPWVSAVDFGTVYMPVFRDGIIAGDDFIYPLLRLSGDVTLDPVPLGSSGYTVVRLFNEGTGPLDVFSVDLTAYSSGFSIGQDDCSGQTIPPQSECSMTVVFTTTELLASRGAVAVLTVDTSDTLQRDNDVRIVAPIPSPRLSLQRVEFLEARLEPPFRRQLARIRNIGEWPTTVGEITVAQISAPPQEFRLVENDCSGQYLDIDQACQLVIEFEPEDEGRANGYYKASYSDDVFESFGELRGYTPTGIPVIDLDGPQDWKMPVGAQEVRHITITNKGPLPFRIFESPESASIFTVTDSNCGLTPIAPGDFCYIDMIIQPVEPRAHAWSYVSLTNSHYDEVIGFWIRVTAVEQNRTLPTPSAPNAPSNSHAAPGKGTGASEISLNVTSMTDM